MILTTSMAQPNSIPKTEASRALEQQIADFLTRGGTISEVKRNGEIVRVKSNIKSDMSASNMRNMDATRKALTDAKLKRLAIQQPIIKEYNEKVTMKEKWTYLIRKSGSSATVSALTKIFRGESTISNPNTFKMIEKAAKAIIEEVESFKDKHEMELLEAKNKGVVTFEKQKRVIEQRPVISSYLEKFEGDFNLTKLAALNEGRISSRHLRALRDGVSTIADEYQWKRLKNTIEGLINEQV